ncbi:cupin domain-containing protein [Bifidobacterium callitrichos]|uniref:cupin domain-containing protein n=1 Tax=Bifidobacterium callitrichos TaxID=762209 RepID=UPI001CC2C26F|nr:cupin domain-containing protein [Bifidobacterium callitrichos]
MADDNQQTEQNEQHACRQGGGHHCKCRRDAEGHAISAEPHLGYVADLASLIDIQEEATVSRTVLREDGLRAVLFAFDKDQALSEHTAAMPVTIQVLEGRLRVGGGEREVELTAGGIVYLSARLPHTVYALEPSKMLLQMFDNRS